MGERITKVGKFIRWCESHKWVSFLIIFGLVIIAIGNFTDALQKIYSLFKRTPAAQIASGWQPPELPEGCKVIALDVGHNYFSWPLSWIENTNFMPGGIILPEGPWPVRPRIKESRLYVDVQTPLSEKKATVRMSNDWDDKIPLNWDRNYSSNAFEIVDEQRLPILQVFYKRPNAITVYGIFPVGDSVIVSFEKGIAKCPANEFASTLAKTSERKAIFKYPAWQHLGEYANP